MPAPENDTWLAVAQLLRPQGRHGELLAEPLTDLPDFFNAGMNVAVAPTEHAEVSRDLRVEDVWWPTGRNAGRIVLRLQGCDTIEHAEALKGSFLRVRTAELPSLPDGTYFVQDLIGCSVVDASTGRCAGEVIGMEYVTAPDGRRSEQAAPLLVVRPISDAGLTSESSTPDDADDELLVPFAADLLVSTDLRSRSIVMNLPDGLLPEVLDPSATPDKAAS